MTHQARVLIVGENPIDCGLLRVLLLGEGYAVRCASTVEMAQGIWEHEVVDFAVVDALSPRLGAHRFCQWVRQRDPLSGLLLLGERRGVDDVVAGFDAGGDDYLARPFDPREFLARVRVLLRRRAAALFVIPGAGGEMDFSLAGRSVRLPGERTIDLTVTESEVLSVLVANYGQVVPRERIVTEVWGGKGRSACIAEVYIGRLRRKMATASARRYIATVRGKGYRLGPPAAYDSGRPPRSCIHVLDGRAPS